jgi:lipoprotein-releasing system permease protein
MIIGIAITAITLSMTVMLVSTALVNGFQHEIRAKVFGFWGHIQVSKFDRNYSFASSPIDKRQTFYETLQDFPNVRHIQQYATKPGIIKVNGQIEGIILKGIAGDFDWTFIQKNLVAGDLLTLHPDSMSFDIMVSKVTATRLKINVGDALPVNFIDPSTLKVRARRFNVAGIYNTGLEEFDRLFMLVDIRQIQRLNSWSENEIGGFEIFVDDLEKLEETEQKVYHMLDMDLNSKTIKQLQPNIFDWLNLQSVNEYLIITLMIVVAVINMITALLILILERTNMIGILKALGGRNRLISRIFLVNAGIIILSGMVLGNVIGLGLIFLQQYFGIVTLPEETYYVAIAPVQINWMTVVLLNAGTFVICMIILLIPSWVVSRIKPIKAIRFE